MGPDNTPDWRYEDGPFNSLRGGRLIARILTANLMAKLPTNAPMAVQVARIRSLVSPERVPLVQNDKGWTCRVWVENALEALRAAGGEFSTIPEVTNGGELEGEIKAFAERSKRELTDPKGTRTIRLASDIPVLDIRA